MVQHSGALGVARQVVRVMDFRKNQGKQPHQNKRLRNMSIYMYILTYMFIYTDTCIYIYCLNF